MAQNTFCRREKKLLIDSSLVPLIRREIEPYMNADKYNFDGRPYEICNLYFDDDIDSVIRHSVSKPDYKRKMRLRSYGTPTMDDVVFLEIKQKFCRVGTKRRLMMPLRNAYTYLESGIHPNGLTAQDEQILQEIDRYQAICTVYPKVYIGYLRNAYHAKNDASFRITFDHDILTRREDVTLEHGRYGDPLLPDGKVLLEIKFSNAVPLWFARTMSKYHLSFGSYSKYGNEYLCHIGQSTFSQK